jgi:hypothetical protein
MQSAYKAKEIPAARSQPEHSPFPPGLGGMLLLQRLLDFAGYGQKLLLRSAVGSGGTAPPDKTCKTYSSAALRLLDRFLHGCGLLN